MKPQVTSRWTVVFWKQGIGPYFIVKNKFFKTFWFKKIKKDAKSERNHTQIEMMFTKI